MANQIPELKDLLSYGLNDRPYDRSSADSDRWLIDHLVEQFIDWEIGTTSSRDLKIAFDQHKARLGDFDLLSFIEEKAAEGEYAKDWADDLT
jgi:hypothetical protein